MPRLRQLVPLKINFTNMIDPKTFTGLIPETPRPTDYVAGVNSPLTAAVVMPSGDWRPYTPDGERQLIGFETYDCTGFSLTNCLETWLNFYIHTNQLPASHLTFLQNEGYLDADGKVNFSDRALGAMAGTNQNGNKLTTVIDTARKLGLASEKLWSFGGSNLAEYYQTPPQQVFDQALRFKQFFEINYEWFYDSPGTYAEAIKQCPLWAALVTCQGWNSPPVQWCGISGTNHAVEITKYDAKSDPFIFDSYSPFSKELSLSYDIPFAMKVFITPKEIMDNIKIVKNGSTVGLLIEAHTIEELQALGGAFNHPVNVDANGNVTNIDITV